MESKDLITINPNLQLFADLLSLIDNKYQMGLGNKKVSLSGDRTHASEDNAS